MLFGYPVDATTDNWLHYCLCEIVRVVHSSVKANRQPPAWPDVVPDMYREQLRSHWGLGKRVVDYANALKTLPLKDQEKVLKALEDQNKISELLSCQCDCDKITDLPKVIREPARSLFQFAFEELISHFKLRDNLYWLIYDAIPDRICPFCGFEFFDSPQGPREALDHYLAESEYPFAGANLRNLVPMGPKCNSTFKKNQDLLWRVEKEKVKGRVKVKAKTRRPAFDPYNVAVNVEISLINSQPCAAPDGQLPIWQIDFIPETPEINTWDEVFDIRRRYIDDVLNKKRYIKWVGAFGKWFRKYRKGVEVTSDSLAEALDVYIEDIEMYKAEGVEFLREHVLRMLHNHCKNNNQRVVEFLGSFIII